MYCMCICKYRFTWDEILQNRQGLYRVCMYVLTCRKHGSYVYVYIYIYIYIYILKYRKHGSYVYTYIYIYIEVF